MPWTKQICGSSAVLLFLRVSNTFWPQPNQSFIELCYPVEQHIHFDFQLYHVESYRLQAVRQFSSVGQFHSSPLVADCWLLTADC